MGFLPFNHILGLVYGAAMRLYLILLLFQIVILSSGVIYLMIIISILLEPSKFCWRWKTGWL